MTLPLSIEVRKALSFPSDHHPHTISHRIVMLSYHSCNPIITFRSFYNLFLRLSTVICCAKETVTPGYPVTAYALKRLNMPFPMKTGTLSPLYGCCIPQPNMVTSNQRVQPDSSETGSILHFLIDQKDVYPRICGLIFVPCNRPTPYNNR
jgi:hypothetical protein